MRSNINTSLATCLPHFNAQFAEKWWADIAREVRRPSSVRPSSSVRRLSSVVGRVVVTLCAQIELDECAVYSYTGEPDPFTAAAPTVSVCRPPPRLSLRCGLAHLATPARSWSFNYFFVDNKRKRILLWCGALQMRLVDGDTGRDDGADVAGGFFGDMDNDDM